MERESLGRDDRREGVFRERQRRLVEMQGLNGSCGGGGHFGSPSVALRTNQEGDFTRKSFFSDLTPLTFEAAWVARSTTSLLSTKPESCTMPRLVSTSMAAAARAPTLLAIALFTLAVTAASSVVWPAVRFSCSCCCEAQPAPSAAASPRLAITNRVRGVMLMPCRRVYRPARADLRRSASARAPAPPAA